MIRHAIYLWKALPGKKNDFSSRFFSIVDLPCSFTALEFVVIPIRHCGSGVFTECFS